MKTLHCISGLGADARVFSFLNIPGWKINPIEWISNNKNEDIQAYATRLASNIEYRSGDVLLGVSFGGVVAQEMSKLFCDNKTIIISSVKRKTEIPWYFRLGGSLRLYYILPMKPSRMTKAIVRYLNGIVSKDERLLMSSIIDETDMEFASWAIQALLKWKNNNNPKNIFHIHGTKDRMLPHRFVKANILLEEGTHFMIVSMADDISALVSTHLNEQKS